MDLNAYQNLGKEPIPGDEPTGTAAKYEPEYEALRVEIGKLDSLQGGQVDWHAVVTNAATLLRDKTKDLLVAVYFTYGLFERAGYPGLACGLGVVDDMQRTFWDAMLPPKHRARARGSAHEWLLTRCEKKLGELGDPGLSDREALESLVERFHAVSSYLGEHLADHAPAFGPVERLVRAKKDALPAPAPAPEEAATPAESAPAAAAETQPPTAEQVAAQPESRPEPPAPAATAEEFRKELDGIRDRLVDGAALLREAEPWDPEPYRLVRFGARGRIAELPEPNDKGNLPGSNGDPALARTLEALLDEGDDLDVVQKVEEAVRKHPFWLDLDWYAHRALTALGRKYRRAAAAVVQEVASFLARVPDLPGATLGDGTPAASAGARMWFEETVLRTGGSAKGGSGAGDDDAGSGDARVERLRADSRAAFARGAADEAVRTLARGLEMTASRKGRFVLRLELAQLLVSARQVERAVPHLEFLETEAQQVGLDDWDPDLASVLLRLLWQCSTGKQKVDSLAERAQEFHTRLCRLDPAAAFDASGPLR